MRSRPWVQSPGKGASIATFLVLVFALSVPFWLLGVTTERQLLPGLPVSALQLVSPVIAAAILVYREEGRAGVVALLTRAADFKRIRPALWYVPILFLMPAMTIAAYWAMRLMGLPLPTPEFPMQALPGMLVLFLVTALPEELGWSGYATDPIQARWGALGAGLLLNLCWQLFPNRGSHYEPRVTGVIIAMVAAVVTIVWGPRTLTRSREAARDAC